MYEARSRVENMRLDSPELEMLVCCARTEMNAENVSHLHHLLEGPFDCCLFLELARQHKVTPLVYRNLRRAAPELCERPELSGLGARARRIAVRSLQLTQELTRILDLLDGQGIPAIPIKGPMLAIEAFGSAGAREFDDLDILIAPSDLRRAMELLRAEGYQPERELTPAQEAAFLLTEHAFQFRRDSGGFVVELHWRLQDRYLSFPFDHQQLWETATTRAVFGRKVLSLSPANLMLYLCMHGAKHFWERLEWIACLPALMRAERDLDWPALFEQADRMGGLRILQLGLLLAHDLDPGPHTETPLRMLSIDPIARQLAGRVWKRLGTPEFTGSRREVYRFRFYLNAREKLADRIRVVRFASIRIPHPNSSQWEHSRVPSCLLFLYYFLSPIRLLRKYGLQGLKGVFRPTEIL